MVDRRFLWTSSKLERAERLLGESVEHATIALELDIDETLVRELAATRYGAHERIHLTSTPDQRRAGRTALRDDHARAGVVTTEEANELLSRFIASHFRSTKRQTAHFTIPADPTRDSDIRLSAFIARVERMERAARALVNLTTVSCPDMIWEERNALAAELPVNVQLRCDPPAPPPLTVTLVRFADGEAVSFVLSQLAGLCEVSKEPGSRSTNVLLYDGRGEHVRGDLAYVMEKIAEKIAERSS